jgi:hypothetical protein
MHRCSCVIEDVLTGDLIHFESCIPLCLMKNDNGGCCQISSSLRSDQVSESANKLLSSSPHIIMYNGGGSEKEELSQETVKISLASL